MKKTLFLILVTLLLTTSCSFTKYAATHDDDLDTGNSANDSDTADSGDDANTGNSVDDSDTADSGDDANTGNSVDDSDTADSGDDVDLADTGDGLAIRIVAGNITSGNYQAYDTAGYDEGIRIFKALKGDIMLVQEFNHANLQSMADQVCPVATCYYSIDSTSFQIPNGVISRWPITSSGWWDDPTLTNRELAWAIIDIPGDRDIFAISVHLHTDPVSDQQIAAAVIADEVDVIKSANPGKYYFVVGGDFNGPSSVDSSYFGKHGDFYVSGPDPVDDNGDEATNATGSKQYDFVLAGTDIHAFQIGVVYPSNIDSSTKTYTNGLVFDTRVYSQGELDEFFPGTDTSDSGASSMQHMAIVKDFFIH